MPEQKHKHENKTMWVVLLTAITMVVEIIFGLITNSMALLAGIALVLKLISHFTKRKIWAEVIVFLVLAGSAVTVSLAGHLGSQLVFIEEVGPGGNYIKQHDE
jgi:uncharacterized protein involved in response to NO